MIELSKEDLHINAFTLYVQLRDRGDGYNAVRLRDGLLKYLYACKNGDSAEETENLYDLYTDIITKAKEKK